MFADYFKKKDKTGEYQKYCFGNLDSFINNYDTIYPEIRSNYSELNMTNYNTPDRYCLQCIEMKECNLCPLETVFSGSIIGKIPGYICEIKKVLRKEKKSFWKELEN
ncbi:MAG: hypothetical protein KAT17_08930 [Candidatus Aminicenantes bacterium]|nr:hypothetical protein [Candidatus Aminicenantes bacterium]